MVMVRRNTLWLAMGLMMLSLASCNKDESGEPFTLSTKQYNGAAKTYINSGTNKEYACWKDGDKVLINGTEKTVSVSSGSGDTYEATVDGSDIAESENYISVYPASSSSISGSAITTTIPRTTTYTTISSGAGAGCQVIDAPMAAYSTTRGLTYENLCALTKFQFNVAAGTTAKLLSLRIVTDKNINGTLTANANGGSWTTSLTGSGASRELSFGDGLELTSTAKAVYLYLPEVSGITSFTVYATVSFGGSVHYFYKAKTGSISLNKGHLYDFGTLTATQSGATYTLTDDQSTSYEEKAPDGSAAFPYCISNATEWTSIMAAHATDPGAYFQLTGAFGITRNESIDDFKGNLDGQGYTITLSNCAVFLYAADATIKNINTIGEIKVESTDDYRSFFNEIAVGTIACSTNNTSIQNCINNAAISIKNCTTNGISIGGIVGDCTGTSNLNKCINQGTINTINCNNSSTIIGGVIGYARKSTSITNCANLGDIDIVGNVGGIAGTLSGANNILFNCYANANLHGTIACGICYNVGNTSAKIKNCYFSGSLQGNNAANICSINRGMVDYCYYPSTYSSNGPSTGNVLGTHCSAITDNTSLAATLNSNISTIPLTGALQWEVKNGIVTFKEQ